MGKIADSDLKYFGLTNDLLFKIVFGSKGNEKLLALLLNALLQLKGKHQIEELEITNPINLPEFKSDKTSIIDVKARDKTGEVYCVEIQVKAHSEILKRILFYSSASYIRQITRGAEYNVLNKTICLWIMCETILPEKEIYNKYLIKHDKNNRVLTDLIEYHFVELSKFDKDKPAMLRNKFEKWLHILKFGNYYQSEADLPDELKKEKGIIEVIKNMSIANTDEQMRHELLARDMFLSDLATDLHAAKKEGRQEGDRLRCEKIALKMIAKGMPFEEVCDITELSIQQIEKLAKNNSKKVSEPAGKYKTSRKTKKPRKK
jgi:predicted transposase/invertase (TIGR01784 family)